MGNDTVGAKVSVHFYGIAGWLHFRGSDCMQVYGDSVPDQAKCPYYHRCPLFRGVRKAGFHCIPLGSTSIQIFWIISYAIQIWWFLCEQIDGTDCMLDPLRMCVG